MRADGTHVRRLTKHAQGHNADWEVQWSPSADRLVFQRFSDHRRGSSAIFTLRLDGTGLRRITPWGEAQYPDWSPDGRWIVFSHGIDAPGDLWMVRPNGTDRHTINDASDIGWISGSFSPDGTMLVWSHAPTGTPDVYVMDGDGSNIQNLTQSPDWESGPDWGPMPA
jgi:TolB protein